jgi:hypothetical protein
MFYLLLGYVFFIFSLCRSMLQRHVGQAASCAFRSVAQTGSVSFCESVSGVLLWSFPWRDLNGDRGEQF